MLKRSDFVNLVFEGARGVPPSELLAFMNVFTTSFEEVVNYQEFLTLLAKFGSGDGMYQPVQTMRHQDLALGGNALDHMNIQEN